MLEGNASMGIIAILVGLLIPAGIIAILVGLLIPAGIIAILVGLLAARYIPPLIVVTEHRWIPAWIPVALVILIFGLTSLFIFDRWGRNESSAPVVSALPSSTPGSSSPSPSPSLRGTTTTLSSSPASTTFGQSVTFTATVVAIASGTGTPGGRVTFLDGGVQIDISDLTGDGRGIATFTTSALSIASHTITATYNGDASFAKSTSANLAYVVSPAATTPAPTPAPVTPAPVTPAPVTPAPVTPAPVTPAPTAAPPPHSVQLTVTSPVRRGSTARADASTTGSSSCTITVHEVNDAPTIAPGLTPKTASSSGAVSWSWTIGANTTPGTWSVDVACTSPSGQRATARATFVVQ